MWKLNCPWGHERAYEGIATGFSPRPTANKEMSVPVAEQRLKTGRTFVRRTGGGIDFQALLRNWDGRAGIMQLLTGNCIKSLLRVENTGRNGIGN